MTRALFFSTIHGKSPYREASKIPEMLNRRTFFVRQNDAGLKKKLQAMEQLVEEGVRDPRLYQHTRQVLFDCGAPGKDQKAEVFCLFEWDKANIAYRRDPYGVETFATPWYTIQARGGDCDDFSIVLCAQLKSVGYRTRFKVIKTYAADNWNHIYPQVEIPRGSNMWLTLDATVPEQPIGWQAPAAIIEKSGIHQISGFNGAMPISGLGV